MSIFPIQLVYTILIASIYNATITNFFDTNHVFSRDFLLIFKIDQIVTMVYNLRLYESINYHLQYHQYKHHDSSTMFCFWFGWHLISIIIVLYYIYSIATIMI